MRKQMPLQRISTIPFTQEGYDKVKEEFEKLTKERPNAVENLRKAREMGDLSENGYYKAAKSRLSGLDARLRSLTRLIRLGRVVPPVSGNWVTIGSEVVVDDGTVERTFSIVGGYESNPTEGKISHVSPLGKALMGRRVGESVTIVIPAGEKKYVVTKVGSS